EGVVLAEGEEIELARAPRGHGDPRQALLPGQRVDQARFSYIGAAGEGRFRPSGLRQVRDPDHAFDEGGWRPEQRLATPEVSRSEFGRGHREDTRDADGRDKPGHDKNLRLVKRPYPSVSLLARFLLFLKPRFSKSGMSTPCRLMITDCWITDSKLFHAQ